MSNLFSVRLLRFIGWAAVIYSLAIILALALVRVNSPTQHGDRSTPAPNATALLGSVLLFSLAAGAGSMAVIQLAKQILGMRAFYQQYRVRRWLEGRGETATWKPAYEDLIRALGYGKGKKRTLRGSEERALFNLPVEQLAAQVSLAADLTLRYPREYGSLLDALTGQREDAERKPSASNGNAVASEATERDIRLSYQVRGGVDGLQLYVGQGWRRTVRLAAVLISGLLGVTWFRFLKIYPSLSVAYILSALILGGFISWFLRDLVAIAERLRG